MKILHETQDTEIWIVSKAEKLLIIKTLNYDVYPGSVDRYPPVPDEEEIEKEMLKVLENSIPFEEDEEEDQAEANPEADVESLVRGKT